GVGTVDPGEPEQPRGLRDRVRVGPVVVGDRQARLRGGLVDALDGARRIAVEDRVVLRVGDAGGRVDQRLQLGILRAPLDGVHLLPRQIEVGPQLDEGQDLPARRLHVGHRALVEPLATSGVHRRAGGPERPHEVDELAASQLQLEDPGGFLVDLLPRGGGDGGELTLEIVHSPFPPFRLPIPSEPELDGADGPPPPASPPPVAACSLAMIEPLLNRYSRRWASILASRRRYHSRSIAKCSFSSSRLWARMSFRPWSVAASTR